MLPIGIQLYTVRDALKEDFRGVIKELAAMGYQGVEFAWNYGGMEPKELAAFLKGLRLRACGLHAPPKDALDPRSAAYDYAKATGCRWITTSMANRVATDWPQAIEDAARMGEAAQERGIAFTYHNHAQEFQKVEGQYALDLLYGRTSPEAVKAELDTYWIKKGGADPVPYILKYCGRLPQVHLKDMNPDDGSFTEIGTGLMDLPGIFRAAQKAGAKWIIYEQDKCDHPPLESARISMENLRAAGLA